MMSRNISEKLVLSKLVIGLIKPKFINIPANIPKEKLVKLKTDRGCDHCCVNAIIDTSFLSFELFMPVDKHFVD